MTRALGEPRHVTAGDGARLAYRELGEGRPLLALHGFFSTGAGNWILNGHARTLAARGHRVIVPDLRAHGRSARPTGAAAYPPDVLVDDALAVLAHAGVTDCDLTDCDVAGYSLGARTVVRMLVRGVPVRRAVVAGQGLRALGHVAGEGPESFFGRVFEATEPYAGPAQAWLAQQWRRRPDDDRVALRQLLDSSVGTPAEQIAAIDVPTLVVMGEADHPDDGRALADALPRGAYVEVPGDHVQAAGRPEVATAIADFLDQQ
jgi:pimeloyl-ACP methyl ester carboxylesterase